MTAHALQALLADLCKEAGMENPDLVIEMGEFEIDGVPVALTSAPDDEHVTIVMSLDALPQEDLAPALTQQLLMLEFDQLGEASPLHFALAPTRDIVASTTVPLAEIGTVQELLEMLESTISEAFDTLDEAMAMALIERALTDPSVRTPPDVPPADATFA